MNSSQSFLFTTDNLGFRPVIESDTTYFNLLDADPETMSFFPGGPRAAEEIEAKVKEYIRYYQKNNYGVFLVFDLTSGEFIGRAGFAETENAEIEVGYLIVKKHWGKGYASRILKALLAWAMVNINQSRIIAFTPVLHTASEKVMQKANMTFVTRGIMKGVECVIYEYKLAV